MEKQKIKIALNLGGNCAHVQRYLKIMNKINMKHRQILLDVDRVRNIHEMSLHSTFEKTVNVFCAASMHHGGFSAAANTTEKKHKIALLAVSVSGQKTPLFFIVYGKYFIYTWFQKLPKGVSR